MKSDILRLTGGLYAYESPTSLRHGSLVIRPDADGEVHISDYNGDAITLDMSWLVKLSKYPTGHLSEAELLTLEEIPESSILAMPVGGIVVPEGTVIPWLTDYAENLGVITRISTSTVLQPVGQNDDLEDLYRLTLVREGQVRPFTFDLTIGIIQDSIAARVPLFLHLSEDLNLMNAPWGPLVAAGWEIIAMNHVDDAGTLKIYCKVGKDAVEHEATELDDDIFRELESLVGLR